jgi:hypothetical protein
MTAVRAAALLSLGLLSVPLHRAEAQAPGDSSFTCRALLDHLKDKIEADYAGYVLEVRHTRRETYAAQISRLEARADTTPPGDCYSVLDALTSWFDDPHVFVYQSVRLDTAESRRRESRVTNLPLDEEQARRYFDDARSLDPIEGIWHDGPTRFAVVRDSEAGAGHFVAVLLTPDSTNWRAGDVRALFHETGDGRYDGSVWLTNYAERHLRVTLHKRVLLRLSPGMWGKVYPVLAADSGLLDPADAHRPTVLVRGRTVIVSMTSHDPSYRRLLDSLLTAHAQDLLTARQLIVDVRGNEGGSSATGKGLWPYVASRSLRPETLDFRRAVMLSSPDQISYAGRAFGSDTTAAFVRSLLARLRATPGGFVPVIDPASPPDPEGPDSVIEGPVRVGILIDRGTVSAAEVLVVEAKRSNRVTIYGEPTAGALDYENVSIVPIASGERRWYLGYPTIAAGTDLPRGGMRGRGITPDVRIDWTRVADPIGEVERRLGGP